MANKLHLEIVTPEARAYSDDVDAVTIPGVEGYLGILPNHIPLMTMIKPGELEVRKGTETIMLATGEGFVEVTGSEIIVLTDMALRAEQIDETSVQEALDRAQAEVKKAEDPDNIAKLELAIQKSVAQLNLKRKRANIR